jgi:hypothetical protein
MPKVLTNFLARAGRAMPLALPFWALAGLAEGPAV